MHSKVYHKVESVFFNDTNMILKVDGKEYIFKLKTFLENCLTHLQMKEKPIK